MKLGISRKCLLLGGVSLFSLAASGSLPAQAANITLTGTTAAAVTVTTAQSLDFILIDNSTITGDVSNSGDIGLGNPNGTGIAITNGSIVGGSVHNNAGGSIAASGIGIGVSSASIASDISNATGGFIHVDASNSSASITSSEVIAGIGVKGGAVSTDISNSGEILVEATGTGIQANYSNTSVGIVGIGVSGTTSAADASIHNSGSLKVHSRRLSSGSGSARASANGIVVADQAGASSKKTDITNSGLIDVLALASETDSATARAMGVSVSQHASAGATATASFSNTASATLMVQARGVGHDTGAPDGTATATGVNLMSQGANVTNMTVTNSGVVKVHATGFASATGSSSTSASASAHAHGFQMSASGSGGVGSTITEKFSNTGDVSVLARATGLAMDYSAEAKARAAGITQMAASASSISLAFANGASAKYTVSALASATAKGTNPSNESATATASAKNAVYQHMTGGTHNDAAITNDGSITVKAIAKAVTHDNSSVSAQATVQDVFHQQATGIGAGSTGSASFTNRGSVEIVGSALVTATTNDVYSASAQVSSVVHQTVGNVGNGVAKITNSGTFSVAVNAHASAPNGSIDDYVSATARNVFYQSANATSSGTGSAVFSNISTTSNVASVDVKATAYAKGTSVSSTVEARVRNLVVQNVSGKNARATITNTGDISAMAKATAIATDDSIDESVRAYVTDVFSQNLYGSGAGSTGVAKFSNSGNITLDASVFASATSSLSSMTARVSGLSQNISGFRTATALATNSGTMALKAMDKAISTADSINESAEATASRAVYQYISGTGASAQAVETFTNSGVLSMTASVTGTASSSPRVSASVMSLAYQTISHVGSGSATISNSGTITAKAKARAIATESEIGYAHARATNIFDQYVYGTGTGATGHASLTNSGSVTVAASVTAAAASSSARNNRVWLSSVVYQQVAGVEQGVATITNAGSLSMSAHVQALARSGSAQATALAKNVFRQVVTAATSPGSALASVLLSNTSNALIMLDAKATATVDPSFGRADANATARSVINQRAQNGQTARAELTNDGTIDINLYAKAVNSSSEAGATVEASGIVYQRATGNGHAGSLAKASFSNSGSLTVDGTAIAKGATSSGHTGVSVTARAFLNHGIKQQAGNAQTGEVDITNSGTIAFAMKARASAYDISSLTSVTAYISSAILQSATASATGPGSRVASAMLNNSNTGHITMFASAVGTAHTSDHDDEGISVEAWIGRGIIQKAENGLTNTASLTNAGTIDMHAHASMSGVTTISYDADVSAWVTHGISQSAGGVGTSSGAATASLANSGTIRMRADAKGYVGSDTRADARAYVSNGIDQKAENASTMRMALTNSGAMDFSATAQASGKSTSAYARARLRNVVQQSNGSTNGGVSESITNSGTIGMYANAMAHASYNRAKAYAYVSESVIQQHVSNATNPVDVSFSNSGTYDVAANATARGTSSAYARAGFSNLLTQYVSVSSASGHGVAALDIVNSGEMTFSASADAMATGTGAAVAEARGTDAFFQGETATLTGSVLLSNTTSATISATVSARAHVSGSSGTATASVSATDLIMQYPRANGAGGLARAQVSNSGSMSLVGHARATAGQVAHAAANLTTPAFSTTASNLFPMIYQKATSGATQQLVVSNSGSMSTLLTARADAFDAAAIAGAGGVSQVLSLGAGNVGTASFVNAASARFSVTAQAEAYGRHGTHTTATATASAFALADGVRQFYAAGDVSRPTAHFNVTNSGFMGIHATATASATGGATSNHEEATALAIGMMLSAVDAAVAADFSVVNSGTLDVRARAAGKKAMALAGGILINADQMGGSFLNSGLIEVTGSAVSATSGGVSALGVLVSADKITADLKNTGTISVHAHGRTGTSLYAAGVVIGDKNGGGTAAATFTNDGGTISAKREWGSGGISRGDAFHVENASYPVKIALKGTVRTGHIFGDIDIGANDSVVVSNGKTAFSGRVNPDNIREGNVTIASSGTLLLVDETSGSLPASGGKADKFTVTSSGTLAMQVDAGGGAGSLSANTVSLDGGFHVTALAGAYASTQTYPDVIVAYTTRTGSFATETINTPLLNLAVTYQTDKTVDLTLTRNAFDSIAGLTRNEKAVAGAIEATYGAGTGAYQGLVNEMFTLGTGDYQKALDSLSGVAYAGAMQAAQNAFGLFLGAVDGHLGAPFGGGGAAVASRNVVTTVSSANYGGGLRGDGVWLSIQGRTGSVDSDSNAAGYDYRGSSFLVGVDAVTDGGWRFGIAGGRYSPGTLKFDNGDRVDQNNGYQIGAYTSFENGAMYFRGMAAYGRWSADATRTITVGTITGTNQSNFNVNAADVHAEVGYAAGNMSGFQITPFAAVDMKYGRIGNVTETGLTSSALKLHGNDNALDATFGVRLSGAFDQGGMMIQPAAMLGIKANLDRTSSVNASFASGPSGTDFSVASPERSQSFVVDLGATVSTSAKTSLSIGYSGEFGSGVHQHAAFAKFKLRF